jgi:enoyl-CoA hydratase
VDELLCEDRGPVRVLTLNRPHKRNALNHALSEALLAALRGADADPGVRALVLTGAGPAFCAGADRSEFGELTGDHPEQVERRAELTANLHGALPNLVRQVGRKAAFELVATGAPIGAARALELGMVNRVVAGTALLGEAMALAEQLAGLSRAALAATKQLFYEVSELPFEQALAAGRGANQRMRGLPQEPAR